MSDCAARPVPVRIGHNIETFIFLDHFLSLGVFTSRRVNRLLPFENLRADRNVVFTQSAFYSTLV